MFSEGVLTKKYDNEDGNATHKACSLRLASRPKKSLKQRTCEDVGAVLRHGEALSVPFGRHVVLSTGSPDCHRLPLPTPHVQHRQLVAGVLA